MDDELLRGLRGNDAVFSFTVRKAIIDLFRFFSLIERFLFEANRRKLGTSYRFLNTILKFSIANTMIILLPEKHVCNFIRNFNENGNFWQSTISWLKARILITEFSEVCQRLV